VRREKIPKPPLWGDAAEKPKKNTSTLKKLSVNVEKNMTLLGIILLMVRI